MRKSHTLAAMRQAATLSALVLVAGTCLAAPPPAPAREVKLIQWGWDTPSPELIPPMIESMQRVPFDGLAIGLMPNGLPDRSDGKARVKSFVYRCWGGETLAEAEFSDSIKALKSVPWGRFTDNFLVFGVQPGNVDWFSDKFDAVPRNAAMLARAARELKFKGIFLDPEQYGGKLWAYKPQGDSPRSFEDCQKQVRLRGRQFMQVINKECPDITILVAMGYSQAFRYLAQDPKKFDKLEKVEYALYPSFLDGMLEAATGGTIIYDGLEETYPFKSERQFAGARRQVLEVGPEKWTAVPDAYRARYRVSFGLWVDLDYVSKYPWDVKDFQRNYFTPEEFGWSMYSAARHTDRYVWVWSQKINQHGGWWGGRMPRPYLDALGLARGPRDKLCAPYEETFDYVAHKAPGSEQFCLTPHKGERSRPSAAAALALCTDDRKAGAAATRADWTASADGPSEGGVVKVCPGEDFRGRTFSVWVKVLTPDAVAAVSIAFYDGTKKAEVHTWEGLTGEWARLTIPVGRKGDAAGFTADPQVPPTNIRRIIFSGVTRKEDQKAAVLWDDFREVGEIGK